MASARRKHLIGNLRTELDLFVRICLLILAVPMLQPFAEARAAENGTSLIICTQFGAVRDLNADPADLPIGFADDCPAGVACPMHHMPPVFLDDNAAIDCRTPIVAESPLLHREALRQDQFTWLRPPGRAPPFNI